MNSQFAAQLERIVGAGGVAYNEPMARHTTFKIGGAADYFVEPRCLSDIQQLVRLCAEQAVELRVLGQGSNVLVADEGVRGVVMHLGSQYAHFETCKELSAVAPTSTDETAGHAPCSNVSTLAAETVHANDSTYASEHAPEAESTDIPVSESAAVIAAHAPCSNDSAAVSTPADAPASTAADASAPCAQHCNSSDAVLIKAQAGVKNSQLARFACDCGLTGFEFASGIPGVVGGSALMNAGAYGSEYSQVVHSLVCVTPDGNLCTISGADAQWGYRRSRMHDQHLIISDVVFRFLPGNKAEIQARMDDLAQRRKSKQPLNMPSAGSTFKRPEGYFAGKLIQDAHLQGERVGGAEVSRKHAGFIVNAGGATARDVYQLIAHVQERVFETAGVHLEPEVRMWGFQH
ncbi:UDP-N-acetylmuramate dehydrogenase [Umbribacter vaginalis]|nr:UDP-N-acetylmuramate dehydrogenase [Coriobacteriales bacterium DNF00809]